VDNLTVFAGSDFDHWAHQQAARGTLNSKEAFLVARYFNAHGRTLDGGTGGGRVLFALQKLGYTDLHGFDFVPASIAAARQRDTSGKIHFAVMDATQVDYESDFFAQVIYAEHMLCFLPEDALRAKALREAHRVLKAGGVAIFTTLLFESRQHSLSQRLFQQYLALYRKITGSTASPQCLPWMKRGGRWNWAALRDAPPYNYWYRIEEFSQDLASAGFCVDALGTDVQIKVQRLCPTAAALAKEPVAGALYAVCRK